MSLSPVGALRLQELISCNAHALPAPQSSRELRSLRAIAFRTFAVVNATPSSLHALIPFLVIDAQDPSFLRKGQHDSLLPPIPR